MGLMAQVDRARSTLQSANEQLSEAKGLCTPGNFGCAVSITVQEFNDRINNEIDGRRTDVAIRSNDRGFDGGTDSMGREILKRYMAGGGDWTINNEPEWTDYMKAAPELESQVEDKLVRKAQDLSVNIPEGETITVPIDERFHADTANGESVNGYQFLHGTNADVGDYQIQGTATVTHTEDGYTVKFNVSHTWNDVIDPNGQYRSDRIKNFAAEVLTLGRADPYDIHITWNEESTIQLDQNGSPLKVEGWPGN